MSESNPNDSVFEQQEVEEDVASPSLETCVVRPTRRHIGVTVRKGNRRIGSVNASPIVKTLSGKICRPSGTPKKNSSKLTSSSDSGKGEIQIPEILKSTQPEETSPASSKSAESPYSKKKLAEQFPVAKNICVESILVEAKLEVVWADGSESTERAVDLAFASFDLDNHSFLPGSFVEFKNVDGAASESQLVGIDKYGIIQKVSYHLSGLTIHSS